MNLYYVAVTHNLVVRAKDALDASRVAIETMDSPEYDNPPCKVTTEREIKTLADLPEKWEGNCLPWGERDPYDRTIARQLAARDGRDA